MGIQESFKQTPGRTLMDVQIGGVTWGILSGPLTTDVKKVFSKMCLSKLNAFFLFISLLSPLLLLCLSSSQEQYKFVYEVALEYLSSF